MHPQGHTYSSRSRQNESDPRTTPPCTFKGTHYCWVAQQARTSIRVSYLARSVRLSISDGRSWITRRHSRARLRTQRRKDETTNTTQPRSPVERSFATSLPSRHTSTSILRSAETSRVPTISQRSKHAAFPANRGTLILSSLFNPETFYVPLFSPSSIVATGRLQSPLPLCTGNMYTYT